MNSTSSIKTVAHALGLVVLVTGTVWGGNHPNSADYYLTTPETFRGQTIVLDVVAVKPVNWKSPVPDISFFQALTWDDKSRGPGGNIMVVVPTADAPKFVKKYGTIARGNNMDRMKGVLTLAPGPNHPPKIGRPEGRGETPGLKEEKRPGRPHGGGPGGPRLWLIDYEGACKEIIEAHRDELKALPENAPEPPPQNP